MRRLSVRSISHEPTLVRAADAAPVGQQGHAVGAGVSLDHHHVDQGHGPLGDAGADRRAGDGPLQPVDQEEVQDDVQRETRGRHKERCACVLQAPQHSGAGEDEQHRHESGHRPAQVVHGEGPHVTAGAHQVDERLGGEEAGGGQDDS